MKLTITLVFVIGYSALVLTNAAQRKPAKVKPARPTPTPVASQTPRATPKPTATPTTAATPTPTATPRPSPTVTPSPSPTATPSPSPAGTPRPAPAASPSTTPRPSPTVVPSHSPTAAPTGSTNPMIVVPVQPSAQGTGAKEPCEDKIQASGIPLCSRVQPDTTVLGKDAVLARNYKKPAGTEKPVGPETFSHKAHTTPAYSVNGRSEVGCAECHHTDQPASALTGVLKTSERNAVLTAAMLTAPGTRPVFSCRACHAQADTKPAVCDGPQASRYAFCPNIPKVTYEDEGEVVLTNAEGYHRNCIICHDKAIAARRSGGPAFLKGTPPTRCAECHK